MTPASKVVNSLALSDRGTFVSGKKIPSYRPLIAPQTCASEPFRIFFMISMAIAVAVVATTAAYSFESFESTYVSGS